MKQNGIFVIIKKELKRFFTDRRMLISLILPGLLIFILYSIMGNVMSTVYTEDSNHTYIVYTINEDTNTKAIFEGIPYTMEYETITNEEIDLAKQKIAAKEADMLIIYSEDFYNKIITYSSGDENTPQIEMYYNSATTESSVIYNYYYSVFSAFESSLTNRFDINSNTANAFDLATSEDTATSFIAMLLPFLILTLLFSGCMGIAPESIAGEKERGTISTLLITPVKRTHLAIGKMISLSIISLCSAVSSFLGTMLSLPKLAQLDGGISVSLYSVGNYLEVLLVLMTTVLVIIGLISVISAYSKSIKEASTYAMPLMIVVMVIGITSMFGTSNSSTAVYFIPIYNSVQCLTAIFSLEVNILNFIITILSNTFYALLLTVLLSKMFNSEKIMFSK